MAEDTFWAKLGRLVAFLVVVPLMALLHAWAASVVWGWFMTPRYGSGPTLEQWYGLSVIVDLLGLAYIAIGVGRLQTDEGFMARVVRSVAVTLLVLAMAFLVKVVCGW